MPLVAMGVPNVCRLQLVMPFSPITRTGLMDPPLTGPLHRAVSNGALLLASPSCSFSELECLDGPQGPGRVRGQVMPDSGVGTAMAEGGLNGP